MHRLLLILFLLPPVLVSTRAAASGEEVVQQAEDPLWEIAFDLAKGWVMLDEHSAPEFFAGTADHPLAVGVRAWFRSRPGVAPHRLLLLGCKNPEECRPDSPAIGLLRQWLDRSPAAREHGYFCDRLSRLFGVRDATGRQLGCQGFAEQGREWFTVEIPATPDRAASRGALLPLGRAGFIAVGLSLTDRSSLPEPGRFRELALSLRATSRRYDVNPTNAPAGAENSAASSLVKRFGGGALWVILGLLIIIFTLRSARRRGDRPTGFVNEDLLAGLRRQRQEELRRRREEKERGTPGGSGD